MTRIFFFLIVAIVLGAVGWGWKTRQNPADIKVLTAEVTTETIVETVEVAGEVKPEVLIEVKPEISARIEKIYVKESDQVTRGQALIDLDNTELLTQKSAAETEIAIAELNLEKSNRDLQRQDRLLKSNIITDQEFRDAKTVRDVTGQNLRKARQELETIESRIVKSKVIAPLEGTVLSLPVVENQIVVGAASVNSGTVLMSVADLRALIITSHVNQVDVARLSVGMSFSFKVDSLGEIEMLGTVLTIAPMATVVNNIKGYVINLKIEAPNPRLRPGMTAQVSIPTNKVENVNALPLSAIFEDKSGHKIVYISRKEGAPEEKTIEVGATNHLYAEVLSGLEKGTQVLLNRPVSTRSPRS